MVEENLKVIRRALDEAASRSKVAGGDIVLVCVTKGIGLAPIFEAIDRGVTHIGENRVQEAVEKFDPVNAYAKEKEVSLAWHMIGHLQTNKVRDAVRIFDLIHSVDSLRLAEAIDQEAQKINKIQNILLEIKTSPEATKVGFSPLEAFDAVAQVLSLSHLSLRGLMTIAPIVENPEQARLYFRTLRGLLDEINLMRNPRKAMRELSMGMTDDFEVAAEEGATMVRIGRGIFGERSG